MMGGNIGTNNSPMSNLTNMAHGNTTSNMGANTNAGQNMPGNGNVPGNMAMNNASFPGGANQFANNGPGGNRMPMPYHMQQQQQQANFYGGGSNQPGQGNVV